MNKHSSKMRVIIVFPLLPQELVDKVIGAHTSQSYGQWSRAGKNTLHMTQEASRIYRQVNG